MRKDEKVRVWLRGLTVMLLLLCVLVLCGCSLYAEPEGTFVKADAAEVTL